MKITRAPSSASLFFARMRQTMPQPRRTLKRMGRPSACVSVDDSAKQINPQSTNGMPSARSRRRGRPPATFRTMRKPRPRSRPIYSPRSGNRPIVNNAIKVGRGEPTLSKITPTPQFHPHLPLPSPLSHIGTSPPQAYPQITPPSPGRGHRNSHLNPRQITPLAFSSAQNKGLRLPWRYLHRIH
jgi:hypothetical protein